ncbi:MAG: chemotaxis protein CheW [Planctomycetota bacterium]|nr:chemotaxis protein CheW [Planctomycetota bacterium]
MRTTDELNLAKALAGRMRSVGEMLSSALLRESDPPYAELLAALAGASEDLEAALQEASALATDPLAELIVGFVETSREAMRLAPCTDEQAITLAELLDQVLRACAECEAQQPALELPESDATPSAAPMDECVAAAEAPPAEHPDAATVRQSEAAQEWSASGLREQLEAPPLAHECAASACTEEVDQASGTPVQDRVEDSPAYASEASETPPAEAISRDPMFEVLDLDSFTGMAASSASDSAAGNEASAPLAGSDGATASPSDEADSLAPECAVDPLVCEDSSGPAEAVADESAVADADVSADAPAAANNAGAAGESGGDACDQGEITDADIARLMGIESFESLERVPLSCQPHQAELLPLMVTDLAAAALELRTHATRCSAADRTGAPALVELGHALEETARFFGFQSLGQAAGIVAAAGERLNGTQDNDCADAALCLHALAVIVDHTSRALSEGHELRWSAGVLSELIGLPASPGGLAGDAPAALPVSEGASGDEAGLTPEQLALLAQAEQEASTWGTTPLILPPDKAEVLQFLISDIKQSAEQLGAVIAEIGNIAARNDIASELTRHSEAMLRTASAFEFRSLNALIKLLGDIGAGLSEVAEPMLPELTIRVNAIRALIEQHTTALEVGMETTWPLETLSTRVHRLLQGCSLAPAILGWHRGDVDRVLELDGVTEGVDPPPRVEPADDASDWTRPATDADPSAAGRRDRSAEPLRVEAAVIEELLETVGELVQHRGRLQSVCEELRRELRSNSRVEELAQTAELIERSMVSLQTGIMSMRMQPLAKLFDRYPRVVRDVARLADKDIELEVHGAATLVDKAILDGLAEPLIAILRNAASKLIETPAERTAAGKPPQGRIRLSARHQGSQVVVSVEDDGAGFDRAWIERQAVEAGLYSPEQASDLNENDVLALVFDAALSRSPLRDVGRSVREGLGGSLMIGSTLGQGARIDIIAPMPSAILSAVIVAVGRSQYTVPLQSVTEITRIDATARRTIAGKPCLVLGERVLPLIDARAAFGDVSEGDAPIALLLTDGRQLASLSVDRVINKQDVVIRNIEHLDLRKGPFSGTSITPDGRVSLVLDVQRLLAGSTVDTCIPNAISGAHP